MNSEEIEIELSALKRGESRTWWKMAVLFNEIATSSYWRRDSRSLTEWINRHAHDYNLSTAMVWRHLTSGRYMRQLMERQFPWHEYVSTLDTLPNNFSAEGVELLAKLERVISKEAFDKLLKRTMEKDLRRPELRNLWKTFRPVLEGKTSRGQSVGVPRVNHEDPKQQQALIDANILNVLRTAKSGWTGVSNPVEYLFYLNVIPDGLSGDENSCKFSAVVIVKPKDGTVQYHAVLLAPTQESLRRMVESQRIYPDYLWVIPRASIQHLSMVEIRREFPEGVGLLNIENDNVHVLVRASRMANSGTCRADLASALLLRSVPK